MRGARTLGHKIRLHPTPEPIQYFKQAAAAERMVWHGALTAWNQQYATACRLCGMAHARAINAARNLYRLATNTALPWRRVRQRTPRGSKILRLIGSRTSTGKSRLSGYRLGTSGQEECCDHQPLQDL
ncbi:MAG: helix-turn-helix domain-containing protein [Sulfobacillus sp.]